MKRPGLCTFALFFVPALWMLTCLFVGIESPAAPAAPSASTEEPAGAAGEWVAPDQAAALERARQVVPFVDAVFEECELCRQERLYEEGLGAKDQTYSYFVLNSPIIEKTEDYYGPVRFMHGKHAALIEDCAACHHYRPADENALETTRCSACHQEPFRKDHPERLGLKAAYHLQCMKCHKNMDKGPIECIGCHDKNVPDHSDFVELKKKPEPTEVTVECLRCHENAGKDMLTSAHWLWMGPSPYTFEHRREVRLGKATTVVNNF